MKYYNNYIKKTKNKTKKERKITKQQKQTNKNKINLTNSATEIKLTHYKL